MTTINRNDVLASISKLRGACVDEIAADLGTPAVSDVSEKLSELAEKGFVRIIGRSVSVTAAGYQRLSPGDFDSTAFEVTPRGLLELRS